ncbi:putative vitellogenin receptor isoform X1 [Drosophila sulfurigaster albostrigata]|uniref:putative vitellogenin receptor isoform X1 n=1 Tax=Drosophila sulfurigaster albostrigata TaxID=89887 RepID=UPI002D219D3C|nr:putative vitellogenin receptor isoform X1 [Drosophila sulfurigaster albostrigata]
MKQNKVIETTNAWSPINNQMAAKLRTNHVRTQWSCWWSLCLYLCQCAAVLLLICGASAAPSPGSAHMRCNADQFQCRNGGCILQAKMCDGRSDCTDNSDELECDYKLCREPHWFPCAQPHGACLAKELKCNGIENCPGGEDERHCSTGDRIFMDYAPRNCSQYEYMCQDHSCIPLDFMCDGKPDCEDNSDENAGCKQSAASCSTGHLCNNGRCLQRKQWQCDGIDDCGDGSDERNCPNLCKPTLGKFLCRNRELCLNLSQVCDGRADCSDGSDESESCHVKPDCNSTKCAPGASCQMMPTTGPECYCPAGFRMMTLQQKCEDINECDEHDDLCSQRCENHSGGFSCACDDGYQLDPSNNRTCYAVDKDNREPLLLYTTQVSVVGMRLHQQQSKLRNHVFTVASNLSKVIGVAYDGEHVYWTNIQHEVESIVRASADGSNAEILLTSGLDAPEDLAVDWLTDNIYISDNVMRHIAVCSPDAVTCVVLVTQDVHQPRGLALWPQRGQMFWTDWGSKPMIARASMDGTRSRPIVSDNIHWPNGIALDMHQERVYWVDAKLGTIETARTDGTARRIVLDGMLKHPYGMAVFEDQLYWSDWGTKSVHACHKFTGKGHRILARDRNIYAVHVYHPSKQPQLPHACETARCSHLCLLAEKDAGGYSCACPEGMQLSPIDQRSCRQVQKKQLLYIGLRSVLLEIEHTSFGRHVVSASHVLPCYISELVYNPINGTIFIADNVQRALLLYDPHESGQRLVTLIYSNLGNVSSLAFDHLAHNLYWTDTERHVIELLSLQTGQRALVRFFAGEEMPIGISVMPAEGYMFVALKARRHTHIDHLALSGLGSQTHVFEDDLGDDDIKFAVDYDSHTMYWADSDVNRISFTNYRQAHQQTFSGRFRRPYSLALVGQDLFWTELGTPAVMWTHKSNMGTHKRFEFDTGNQRIASVPPPPRHIPLTASVRVPLEARSHPCQQANGGCSHVCVSAGQFGSACLCPAGFVYRDVHNRTCIEALDCEFRCRTSGECLTMAHRCNGRKDCADASDEANCELVNGGATKTRINIKCAIDEFTCHNGEQCLEKSKRCNGQKECSDGSDEDHCAQFDRTKLCHDHQHACDNGKCVDYSLMCDGTDDCGDNSDELAASCARPAKCGVGMFQCSSGSCIASGWECDGKIDCSDASDEHDKCGKRECPENMHRCLLGQCIDRQLVCDGHNDCGDRSDELNCGPNAGAGAAGINISCGSVEQPMYQCASNLQLCLPTAVRCNGTAECPRGEDEADCGDMCGITEFQCRESKECIRLEFRCDKERDCRDGSDEAQCDASSTANGNGTTAMTSGRRACKPHLFDCHDGECVDMSRVCDGFEDCANGSDEGPKCSSACSKHICQHMCRATPAGAVCTCRDGYRLGIDQRSCLDIDECAPPASGNEQSPCAQICENTPGSYQCQCYPDFMLRQDRSSCKSIDTQDGGPSFLFSSYDEVRNLSERHAMLSVAWSANDTRISGIDVDMRRQLGYFSSDEQHVVYQLDMRDRRPLAALSLNAPTKLAVEWTTGNVYVISGNAAQQISVCSFAAKMCGRVLQLPHGRGHATLKSLAVDGHHARLFYAVMRQESFGQPETELYVARLDGSRRELLLRKERSYVTSIAIDPHQQLLYFVDLHTRTLEVISYKARGNRQSRILLQKSNALRRPTGLSIYENHAYIVNMGANELVRYRLYGQLTATAIPLSVTNAQDIVVAGQSRQPAAPSNPCEHAHCSGMCVLADYGYECMCGSEIVSESHPCPHGTTNELDIDALISGDQSEQSNSSSSGIIFAFVCIIIGGILIVLGIGYYRYRARGHRDLNITLHFQNPLATHGGKAITESDGPNELDDGNNSRPQAADATFSTKRKTIQFDVLQKFMRHKNSQNVELATEMSLENGRASELQSLVNERRDTRIPNIVVAGAGDDVATPGFYGGDFGSDDVHARLVP